MCIEYAYSNLLVHSNYLLSLLCQIIKKNIQENDASFSHYKILELYWKKFFAQIFFNFAMTEVVQQSNIVKSGLQLKNWWLVLQVKWYHIFNYIILFWSNKCIFAREIQIYTVIEFTRLTRAWRSVYMFIHICAKSVLICVVVSISIRPLPVCADVRTKTTEGMTIKHDVPKLFKLKQLRKVKVWEE